MENTPQIKMMNDIGFAKTILMPGDPIRSKMIAMTFLEDPVLVNNVRGVQGYTGYYKEHKVSVMASGMGIPSIALYAYELYNFFGVENIIRVGTAGGLCEDLKLYDIVMGIGANTDSNFAKQFIAEGTISPTCSFELLNIAEKVAKNIGVSPKIGNFYTTDSFYCAIPDINRKWSNMGSIAVDMETAGLYLTAMHCQKKALSVCTISDLPLLPGCPKCSVEERESFFSEMINIALETARLID